MAEPWHTHNQRNPQSSFGWFLQVVSTPFLSLQIHVPTLRWELKSSKREQILPQNLMPCCLSSLLLLMLWPIWEFLLLFEPFIFSIQNGFLSSIYFLEHFILILSSLCGFLVTWPDLCSLLRPPYHLTLHVINVISWESQRRRMYLNLLGLEVRSLLKACLALTAFAL